MSKLLINDSDKLLVGSNGMAYAVRNLDVLKGSTSPVDFTAAAGKILRLMRYGKCEQGGTPTPDAPVDIVCNNGAIKFSPNMANVNEQTALVGYYISAQGVVTADTNNWLCQDFIPVKPNTTYTLSMSQSVYFVSISEYSTAADSGFIIRKAGATGSNTSLTITTGANTNFIRFGTNIDRVAVTMKMVLGINWMLNLGGTAMDYQPYVEGGIYTNGTAEVITDANGNTASVVNLLGVGNYADTQEIISGAIRRIVGVYVFDGTENFTASSSGAMVTKINDVAIGAENTPMNTHFALATSPTSVAVGTQRFGANGTKIYSTNYYMKHATITTVADFKSWLAQQYAAGTPVIVIYPLATPTTESVAPQPLNTVAGTNTLTDTANVSSPEYNVTYKI